MLDTGLNVAVPAGAGLEPCLGPDSLPDFFFDKAPALMALTAFVDVIESIAPCCRSLQLASTSSSMSAQVASGESRTKADLKMHGSSR